MSKTISFVATDELAEWLEEESERRMTTISSTAQQLLAEKYREMQEEEEEPAETPEEESREPEEEEASESDSEEGSDDPDLPAAFDDHPDKWYVPNSQEGYKYAVRMPGETSNKYYKTAEGAAERLREEFE